MSSISQKMFDDRMKALEKKLDFIISKQSELAITVSSISDEVQILKNESKSRDSKIVFLENQLEEQKSRCDTIEAKLLEMEVKDRKLNLIIHGLSKEKQQQTVFANVSTLFSSTMEITDKVQILQCYRMDFSDMYFEAAVVESRDKSSPGEDFPNYTVLGQETLKEASLAQGGEVLAVELAKTRNRQGIPGTENWDGSTTNGPGR
ncbi:hypothetical protein QYM36_001756 [Artemia franciscana]|uniref:Uncharacterized protein n=1 Tax=Artemia franciscana TaxID=6661 RepID=A0AA88I3A3_ARTSF|nr:hypothetical protein QYM36_001756 [Artemia franciscana]